MTKPAPEPIDPAKLPELARAVIAPGAPASLELKGAETALIAE